MAERHAERKAQRRDADGIAWAVLEPVEEMELPPVGQDENRQRDRDGHCAQTVARPGLRCGVARQRPVADHRGANTQMMRRRRQATGVV